MRSVLNFFSLYCCQKSTASHVDRDFSVDRPDPDHDKALMREKEQRRRGEKEKERRDEIERERGDRDFDHDGMLQKRKSGRRVEDSVADQFYQGADGDENFEMYPGLSSYGDKSYFKVSVLGARLIKEAGK